MDAAWLRGLNEDQLRNVYADEKDRAERYRDEPRASEERKAETWQDYQDCRTEMARRGLLEN
jgi:hypothetical protein